MTSITQNQWTLHYTIGRVLAAKVKPGDVVLMPGGRGDLIVLGGRAPLRANDRGSVTVRDALAERSDPMGSQRAWDLFVKSRYLAGTNPGRELILSSGTPITNTLGEMYTLQRFMQPDELHAKGLHEFDAWASAFGDTRTELELQPSGSYKPVTRFCEFVNVADLMAMYRSVADVVLKDDLRQYVKLPTIRGGKRQIIVAKSGAPFKAYQRVLAKRIQAIETRGGRPQKGDDILLSVITDGRHSAIDLRFVDADVGNEEGNKLNLLIENAYRIWEETADYRYSDPETGKPYPLPGAVQMIFSDLGTEAALETRGFSAYVWIRDRLVAMGVPAEQIAFMQHYKKNSAKQRLFNDLNHGRNFPSSFPRTACHAGGNVTAGVNGPVGG